MTTITLSINKLTFQLIPVLLKLSGGEWAFLPTIADKTLKAYAATADIILEFAVFGTDQ